MEVRLTDFEIKIARKLGASRDQQNIDQGVPDQKVGPQDGRHININGVGAELAFCKAFNVFPDLELGQWPDQDATLPCGATVDVKHTERENGQLLVRKNKAEKRCDFYVLVTGMMPAFRIRGGMRAEMLFQDERITDLGYGPTYAVPQSELWPVDDLVWVHEYENWKPPSRTETRGDPGITAGDHGKRDSFGFTRPSDAA